MTKFKLQWFNFGHYFYYNVLNGNFHNLTIFFRKTFWELTYYILYKGQLIHSTTWPHLDLKLLDISAQKSFTILTNIDTKFYTNLLSFYSNYKLSKTKLTLLERQITNKFLEENTGILWFDCFVYHFIL